MYTQTSSPSEILKILVSYIINVYAPTFFSVKEKSDIRNGSIHLFNQIVNAKAILSKPHFEIVAKVIKNNCYYAHPENLLLAMLFDDDLKIRKMAVKIILEARKRNRQSNSVRRFLLPKDYLNFGAKYYYKMIDFNRIPKSFITPPPILQNISDKMLNDYASGLCDLEIIHLPCHNTCIERCVKHTTEASQKAIGYEKRDAYILLPAKQVGNLCQNKFFLLWPIINPTLLIITYLPKYISGWSHCISVFWLGQVYLALGHHNI